MAEIPLSIVGNSNSVKATLDAGDTTSWYSASKGATVFVDNGDEFSVDVEWGSDAAGDNSVLVGTQDETERGANYDWFGPGFVRVTATSITNGPITVIINSAA